MAGIQIIFKNFFPVPYRTAGIL